MMGITKIDMSTLISLYYIQFMMSFPILPSPDTFVNIIMSHQTRWWSNCPEIDQEDELFNYFELIKHISTGHQGITFTIFEVERFHFALEMDSAKRNIVGDLTVTTAYFRFVHKLRHLKTVFILLTGTFNETINAIQNSGYATSDQVGFFVQVTKVSIQDKIIRQFHTDLFTTDEEIQPFYAPIVFYAKHHSQFALFCYFCADKPTSAQKSIDEPQPKYLSFLSNAQRRHGYSMTVKLNVHAFQETIPKDLSSSLWLEFYKNLRKTGMTEIWVLYSILHHVNISSVTKTLAEPQLTKSKWLLNIYAGERGITGIPNVIARTRGGFTITGETHWKIIACVNTHSVNSISYTLPSIFVPQLWTQIIFVVLLVSFIYKNVTLGMDIIRLFLGWECELKHPRNVVGYILISVSIVTYTNSAYISTDLMQLAKFPTAKMLIRDGYKVWSHSGATALFEYFYKDFPTRVKQSLERFLDGKKITDALSDGTPIISSNTLKLILKIVNEKLLLWGYNHVDLLQKLGAGLKYIRQKYICKVINLSDEIDGVGDQRTLRVWGYLSSKLMKLHSRFFQMGFYVHAKNAINYYSQQETKDLDLMDAGDFLIPQPKSFKSIIGISSVYMVAIQTLVFFAWLAWRMLVLRMEHLISDSADVQQNPDLPSPDNEEPKILVEIDQSQSMKERGEVVSKSSDAANEQIASEEITGGVEGCIDSQIYNYITESITENEVDLVSLEKC